MSDKTSVRYREGLTSSGNDVLSELMTRSSDLIKLRFAPSSLAIRKSCAQCVNRKPIFLRYADFARTRIGL